ncbi:reverse transcriptase family protein [Brenneria corticis]|uniref:RNA-directed DNA polymerase n=1 Tax=Brenneria corticis TaxID=2173106 RepID=A0A2U1TTC9_9GAMM|nr:reverse transcriptase family protein [Brenneria sp. CFCC 11842]PWC12649.1 RNA-directed DNA polymerase [Brenneria sp. CFCC 11842]
MDKPYYPHNPISDVSTLAKTLGINEVMLNVIVSNVDTSYTKFDIPSKNKTRTVYEPKLNLKKIQKRINSRIFEAIQFPIYLQGGIKDSVDKRDYVENARTHSVNSPSTLINLDIKSFYDNIKYDKVFDIFKYFFKFPDDVSKVLTDLTTFKNKVPQGACTSSYLANLVFFNTEYSIVSSLRGKEIYYTRLLDDVTMSACCVLPEEIISESIKKVVGMFKQYGFKSNNKKKKIEYNKNMKGGFQVTGLWIGHTNPKTTKKERRFIRLLVHTCFKKYNESMTNESYHELWNKASGLVAKLKRLDQSNHKALREKLASILPLYDDSERKKIVHECNRLLKIPSSKTLTYGEIDRINRVFYKLGILSRSEKNLSRMWRRKLKQHFKNIPKKRASWL